MFPDEPKVTKYLTHLRKPTQIVYGAAYTRFKEFYPKPIEAFIEAVYADRKRPLDEQDRYAEMILQQYVHWLQKQDTAPKTIRAYTAALQSLLRYYHLPVTLRYITLPHQLPRKQNRKHEWTLETIKRFVGLAKNYRDKAIILCLFQSGMGVAELCSLDYRDVKDELERGVLPLAIDLARIKTGIPYKTFLGRDAVNYLRL